MKATIVIFGAMLAILNTVGAAPSGRKPHPKWGPLTNREYFFERLGLAQQYIVQSAGDRINTTQLPPMFLRSARLLPFAERDAEGNPTGLTAVKDVNDLRVLHTIFNWEGEIHNLYEFTGEDDYIYSNNDGLGPEIHQGGLIDIRTLKVTIGDAFDSLLKEYPKLRRKAIEKVELTQTLVDGSETPAVETLTQPSYFFYFESTVKGVYTVGAWDNKFGRNKRTPEDEETKVEWVGPGWSSDDST